jgi:muconolactone delta-isomerase
LYVGAGVRRSAVEFLVEFEVNVPDGTPDAEVQRRNNAEAAAAAELVEQGHLRRVWKKRVSADRANVVGLYRADNEAQLDRLLDSLPLAEWMHVTVTRLDRHPNDPALHAAFDGSSLPTPRLAAVYRLEATISHPHEFGETADGYRRIVPLTGGTFRGPEMSGKLLPGASADWQVLRPDGTALGDIRYTLQTDRGDLLSVRSRSVRHGPAEVLERVARGEDVDPHEYTFRASTRIETAASGLDWLNKGIFVSVGARQPAGVTYETYLVE